ncbi:MAG: alpha/beta fold hydrolase [Rhizomicrobium sp.]|nr:alpha/beta fold hydrolase [Rhizomicrobium sp.]
MDDRPHLLLLPGMLSDDAFWRAQSEALADVARVKVVDYGGAASIDDMAQAVLANAPESFALAGHSLGGRVALAVYAQVPQRVRKLGLLCTDYRGHLSAAARTAEITARNALLDSAALEGMAGVARQWATHVLPPARLDDARLVAAIVAMAARQSPTALAAQIQAGLTRPDFTELLHTITCSTLICAGEEDSMRPVAVHQAMAAAIPHSRLVIIAEAGHMVAMEQPEAVSAAMRRWLMS